VVNTHRRAGENGKSLLPYLGDPMLPRGADWLNRAL
jgi:hypothetical protein